jgi:hypothetical protein
MDLNLDLLCSNGSPNFSNLDLAKQFIMNVTVILLCCKILC